MSKIRYYCPTINLYSINWNFLAHLRRLRCFVCKKQRLLRRKLMNWRRSCNRQRLSVCLSVCAKFSSDFHQQLYSIMDYCLGRIDYTLGLIRPTHSSRMTVNLDFRHSIHTVYFSSKFARWRLHC